jgi:hypothetical protein
VKFDYKRSDWVRNSRPVVGPAFPGWQAIKAFSIHWPGADWEGMDFNRDGTEDYRDTATLLDNTNGWYWSSRGYALGYGVAADVFGWRWQVRGTTYQNAANLGFNTSRLSILVIVDIGADPTEAQIEAVRQIIAEGRVLAGWDIPIEPHSATRETACPGPEIGELIASGVFEPRVSLPAPVLKFRDRGPRVRELRDHLVFWGMQRRAGSFFGTGTRAAVRRWQRALGVKVTGRYDLATYDAYRKSVGL